MADYIVAIDQGTTSTRAIVFDHSGSIISVGQKEHEQIFPRAGWVEHDPSEIWDNTREVIGQALSRADITTCDPDAAEPGTPRGVLGTARVTVPDDTGADTAVFAHVSQDGADEVSAGDYITVRSYPVSTGSQDVVVEVVRIG